MPRPTVINGIDKRIFGLVKQKLRRGERVVAVLKTIEEEATYTEYARLALKDVVASLASWSDYEIASDLEDLASKVWPVKQREVVRAYGRARKNAPGFDGNRNPTSAKPSRNNHAKISRSVLRDIWKTETCDHCGKPFNAKRSDARYCNARCRQAAKRVSDHAK